ncbi:MAG: type II secretion system secretin GspD, partial [Pseudomonadota bacterium]
MKTRINHDSRTRWLRSLTAFAMLVLASINVTAQDAGSITPNYRDADIREVIEAVQAVTGKTFIVDARVNAKVTLIASEPMSNEEFYSAFLSILRVNSFQAIENDGVVKIIPDAQTRTYATPPSAREADAITTTVLRLENINAAQLVPVMRPLMSTSAHLAAVQSSNALIVSDNSANVQRIRYLIRQIDRPVESDVEVIRLENASATEIVTTLNALTNATRADGAVGAAGPSVVADARTNSVLVAGTAAARVKIRALIAHLDTPPQEGGDTQVRFLNYASAEDLATKLTGQIQQENQGQQPTPGQQELNIWADERMNALVISGPQASIRRVLQIVDQLDVRRAQVLVEALIVEVTLTENSNLGVSIAATDESGDNPLFVSEPSATGGLSGALGSLGTDGNDAAAIAQLISQGLTLGVGRIVDDGISFAAVLNALQSDSNTNVISTPTLVTLDNEEAKISIGSEVPFATGQFTNTGGNNNGAVNPFQTIQREPVGTSLEITPQINEGDAILLKVVQEVSSLSTDSVQGQPIT